MLSNLTGWHFLIILVVILLLFGAPKLPGLARSLGQSMKILKEETKSAREPEATVSSEAAATTTVVPPAASTPVAPEASSVPADNLNKQ